MANNLAYGSQGRRPLSLAQMAHASGVARTPGYTWNGRLIPKPPVYTGGPTPNPTGGGLSAMPLNPNPAGVDPRGPRTEFPGTPTNWMPTSPPPPAPAPPPSFADFVSSSPGVSGSSYEGTPSGPYTGGPTPDPAYGGGLSAMPLVPGTGTPDPRPRKPEFPGTPTNWMPQSPGGGQTNWMPPATTPRVRKPKPGVSGYRPGAGWTTGSSNY